MRKDQHKKEHVKKLPPGKGPQHKKAAGKKPPSDLIGLAVIILWGIIIYSNSFDCSFHFDDFPHIVDNTKIQDLSDVGAIWNYIPNRPVAMFTFALNYHFNQLDVGGYHLVNLAVHLLNAVLVWWLTLLILSSPVLRDHEVARHKKLFAFATALMFVSHPLATQSVTYIIQRMTSMAALFYLLSVALYMKARISEKATPLKILLFAGSAVSAAFAMLTKENAFTLPFALILVEFFFIRTGKITRYFRDYRVILALAGLLTILVIIAFRFSFSIFEPVRPYGGYTYTLTPANYLFTQFSVVVKYIQLLVLPVNLHLDYNYPISESFFGTRALLSFLVLLSILVLAIFLFNRNRIISFGIFWFFLTLSVESSIIPIRDVINEHRTYLPSFGFFLILSSLIYLFSRGKYKLYAVAVLVMIIAINSYLTYQRNKVWKDELSLWDDNVKKAPDFARPLYNRGCTYENLQQPDKALADYSRAIELDPRFAKPYYNRGHLYGSLQQWDKAIADYNKVVEIDTSFIQAYYNRAVIRGDLGEWDQAVKDYSKAIEGDPGYTHAFYNRGIAYGALQQWDKAIADYSRAIELNPDYKEAFVNRGAAYMNTGQVEKAIDDYSSALRIDPGFTIARTNLEIATRNLQNRKNP